MKFARLVYTLLWLLALPFAILRLLWRARREPGYRQHIAERLSFYQPLPPGDWLWLHAVSVGETRAAQPLIEALLTYSPTLNILLTHMTPSGRHTGEILFSQHLTSQRMQQAYIPYDIPWFVRRFLRHTRAQLGLLIETEVWPNLIWQARAQNRAIVLVNARMSLRSFQRAKCFGYLSHALFSSLPLALAQTPADAQRLKQLGTIKVQVCGNIKFDIRPHAVDISNGAVLRQYLGVQRRVLCAASTREGEEAFIFRAWKALQETYGWAREALLILVPRHPQRAVQLAQEARAHGFTVLLRSDLPDDISQLTTAAGHSPSTTAQILIGDSLGEMSMYYSTCDLALIGGSLLPFGGQNLIEACALGKPVLLGPHVFNFSQASEDAKQCGAAEQIPSISDQALVKHIAVLLNDTTRLAQMGAAGMQFAQAHRGATQRTMDAVTPLLKSLPLAQ